MIFMVTVACLISREKGFDPGGVMSMGVMVTASEVIRKQCRIDTYLATSM